MKPFTILCVDDESKVLKALGRLLRKEGCEFFTALNAEEGFNILEQHQVQVVMSDQRMPGMQGTEFLQYVKNLYPDTIRIILSAHADEMSVLSALYKGEVHRFFTKPWDDCKLMENIRKCLERYNTSDKPNVLSRDII